MQPIYSESSFSSNKIEEDVADLYGSFWGNSCTTSSQCLEDLAYCDKSQGLTGERFIDILVFFSPNMRVRFDERPENIEPK